MYSICRGAGRNAYSVVVIARVINVRQFVAEGESITLNLAGGVKSEEWQMLRPVSHSLEQCWRGLEQMWRSARAFTLTRLATQPCPDSGEALPTALFADP